MSKGTTHIPVVAVFVIKAGKILAVLRKNSGWQDGSYSPPGGHVEYGESYKQAALRELKEEVGLDCTKEQLEHEMTFQEFTPADKDQRTCVVFKPIDWSGEPYNAEPEVHESIAWLELNNLPDNLTPQFKKTLEALKNNVTYAEYGLS